jgi:hypothetical protein
MSAKVAYASISEKGTINGAAGNQTGKELKVREYYDFGQTLYFRFNNSTDAWYMGTIAERLAKNLKIGYSQADRASLYQQAKKTGWQSKKITEPCNCDCSQLVAVAFNCVFEEDILGKDTYTGNLSYKLANSKKGMVNKVGKSYKPMCGDIVWKPDKHVVTVCSSIK